METIMMDTELLKLTDQYRDALQSHCGLAPHSNLQAAHELGAQAVAIGLETLAFAKMHEAAVATVVLPGYAAIVRETMISRAGLFFSEAMRPIEETHRAAQETSLQLHRVSETLEQCTKEVADSNRELHRQMTERKTAEAALETSQRLSGKLLAESRHLEKHLQELARKTLSVNEAERKTMSLQLHNEIAQTMLGIQVRLLALKKDAAANNADLRNEIAITQRLVDASVKTINQFVQGLGAHHGKQAN